MNNTNDYNGIIDENEEYVEYAPKKHSINKDHKKNGQLLIKYLDNYKYITFHKIFSKDDFDPIPFFVRNSFFIHAVFKYR